MEHVIKINDKIFKIAGYRNNTTLICPQGSVCYLNKQAMVILHRDSQGMVQSEPILTW